MIISICARCGRKHVSDEVHSGKHLRCAGCGDAIQIGNAPEEFAVGKQVLDGEVVNRSPGKWNRSSKRHQLVSRKYVLAGALVVLALPIGGVLIARKTEHGPSETDANRKASQPPSVRQGESESDPYEVIAEKPSVATSSVPQVDPFRGISTHSTGDKIFSCPAMRGRGTFTFKNGTDGDAVVTLRDRADKVAASIYIDNNENGVIRNIKPGVYSVEIAQGKGWDDDTNAFKADPAYFRIPHPYSFTETEEDDRVVYSTVELTLYRVFNGNVERESISHADFARN